jgi:radical SAM superfamily enzyme YgiQ (UPF0313 family)
VTIIDEGVEPVAGCPRTDLLGISAATPNAWRAYELADAARSRGVPVVLGGVHPSLLPAEAREHADAVVVGYAEEAWPRLLRDFAAGGMREFYTGDAREAFTHGLGRPQRRLLKKGAYFFPHTIEATRGCPHQCEFCVVPSFHGRRPWRRPVGEVIRDLRGMHARRVVFLDANPGECTGYSRALLEAMIPLRIRWYSSVTMRAARDDEWLALARRSGCEGVLIGFESLCQESLDRHAKRFNRVGEFAETVAKLHRAGIMVLGCFVFGLESDDAGVFARTVAFADQARIDLVQYAIYTPFPGTPAFRRLDAEGRIRSVDWSRYDGKQVVFEPARMSARELQEGFHRAWRQTYRPGSILRRTAAVPSPRAILRLMANLGFRSFGNEFIPACPGGSA